MPASSLRPDQAALDAVFVVPYLGPLIVGDGAADGRYPGGAETQMLLLLTTLARRGMSVGVVVNESTESLPRALDGFRVIPRRRWSFRAGPIAPILRRVSAVTTLARSLRVDAKVFVQRSAGTETAVVGLIARLRSRRFVYSSSNVVDFDFGRLERRRWRVWLFELGVRLADVVVVQTPEQVQLCRQRFGRDAVLIRSIAEPAPRAGHPEAFLWAGRLSPYKRPLAYIELATAVPEAQFWMVPVSNTPEAAELARKINDAASRLPNLTILPPRPRSELMLLMERAVAVVNTSEYEGMPNVFLEAWSRGVPSITLDHDPDGVIERENLGAFAGGSASVLAQQTREIWWQRSQLDDLAARCRDYVTRAHSPQQAAQRWEMVLRGSVPEETDELNPN